MHLFPPIKGLFLGLYACLHYYNISCYANAKEWNIAIKDEGKGIDSEILPRLFTKFATKSEHGIGLGLYISKSIIEAHGGKIWAEIIKMKVELHLALACQLHFELENVHEREERVIEIRLPHNSLIRYEKVRCLEQCRTILQHLTQLLWINRS